MKKNPASRARTPAARENVLRSLHKPPKNDCKNDCLDAEREPSNARLPEVGSQRQTHRQNYDIDAVFYRAGNGNEEIPSGCRAKRGSSGFCCYIRKLIGSYHGNFLFIGTAI